MNAPAVQAAVVQRVVPGHTVDKGPDGQVAEGWGVAFQVRRLVVDLAEGAHRNGQSVDWTTLVISAAPAPNGSDGIVVSARAGTR